MANIDIIEIQAFEPRCLDCGETVTAVRTMQMRRHEVTRGRTRGTTPRWKKAIVTLKEGDSIAVFEG